MPNSRPIGSTRPLAKIARDVRDTDLPDGWRRTIRPPVRVTVGAEAGEYEQILHSAMLLFNERGYRDTGMDDIAAAVECPTTSLYRFFSGKGAILAAAYRRAADRVSGDLSSILATADGPRDAVERAGRCLRASVLRQPGASPTSTTRSESTSLPRTRSHYTTSNCATMDAWVRQVAAAVPEISADEARFAVHAGFALVVDLGRFVRYAHSESALAVVRHLLLTVLVGDGKRPRRRRSRRVAS